MKFGDACLVRGNSLNRSIPTDTFRLQQRRLPDTSVRHRIARSQSLLDVKRYSIDAGTHIDPFERNPSRTSGAASICACQINVGVLCRSMSFFKVKNPSFLR